MGRKLCSSEKEKPLEPFSSNGFPALRASLGGDKRDRTADLLNAIQALSQLSYTPNFAVRRFIWRTTKVILAGHVSVVNRNFQISEKFF